MDVTARAELSLPPPSDKTRPAGNMVCYLQVQEVSSLSLVLFVTVTSFSTSTQVCARARGRGVGCEAPSSALHLVLLPGVFCPFLDKEAKAEGFFWFLLSFSLPPPHAYSSPIRDTFRAPHPAPPQRLSPSVGSVLSRLCLLLSFPRQSWPWGRSCLFCPLLRPQHRAGHTVSPRSRAVG